MKFNVYAGAWFRVGNASGATPTTAMYINSSGNVGIGTTSPGQKLSVYEDTNGQARLSLTNPNAGTSAKSFLYAITTGNRYVGFVQSGANTTGTTSGISNSSLSLIESGGDASALLINAGGTVPLIFATSDTERMRITSGGRVGIGTTSPVSLLQVVGAAVQTEGLLNVSNTYAAGNVYYPAAKIRNTRGDHSYGIVSEFSIGSVGGTDRSSILFYSDATSHSWQIGQVTAAWGTADSFGIGYRANNSPSTFTGWPTSYFIITTGGDVGIGTSSPGYKLDVTGTIRATADIIAYSDARVKDNVKTIEAPLEIVKGLRGVTYTRNDNEDKSRKVGVIAQEVLSILPEVVQQDDNGNYSVAYGNIVGVLIEAIKEQQLQIEELKTLIHGLTK
jgi:hypothetical protein